MSRNLFLSLTLFSVIMLFGCSSQIDNLIDMPDASRSADMTLSACALMRNSDMATYTCLSCPEWCNTSDTDMCDPQTRTCICGLEGRECGVGEECRYGVCTPSDPNGASCEFDDVCVAGKLCIEARCSTAPCRPEICNGYDDDCDGFIDNAGPGPLARWCYNQILPANPDAFLTPPCRPGNQLCANGAWQACVGAVSPIPEIGTLACDGIDNNCDGCVDGTGTADSCTRHVVTGFDIVFLIDLSGSMGPFIEAVKEAVSLFAATGVSPVGSRYAVIGFPSNADRDWFVITDFVDIATFSTVIAGISVNLGGAEGSYDVLTAVFTGNDTLSWRPGTIRTVILFADEAGQSYTNPLNTEESTCNRMTQGEVFAAVTPPNMARFYDMCAVSFELVDDGVRMANNLSAIIQNPCN
jgi:hypothetical protein